MAHDLFGDVQAALELRDGLGGRVEQDDEVRAFAVGIDGVGEAAAAPRAHLDDLAAGGGDAARDAVEDLLDPVIGVSGRMTSISS